MPGARLAELRRYSESVTSGAGWVADPEIDAAFDELAKSQSVAFGGVGFANIEGPASIAFSKIRAASASYLKPLHRLLIEASPAGRVYAATLLTAIDQEAGRRAWEHLATQDEALEVCTGCLVNTARLSEYAIKQLANAGVTHPPENTSRAAPTVVTARPDDIPPGPQFPCELGYAAVDSVAARQEIAAAFHGRPRIVLVNARNEQQFVQSLFPEVRPPTAVYVRRETRDGRSRRPEFDLYQPIVHRDYPFVATLNLVGDASVESTVLDQALASYYFTHYPQPSETAYTARHLVSELALMQRQRAPWETGRIGPGVGMIVPQREFALPIVTDLRPHAEHGPAYGIFLKFLVPRPDRGSFAFVERQGFSRWRPGTNWFGEGETQRPSLKPQTDWRI
ncbi:MAG: hypothetical protein QOG37_1877 [Mycobacterium sp.]|nr:hypothetical protein [Mycobacterium sp.]